MVTIIVILLYYFNCKRTTSYLKEFLNIQPFQLNQEVPTIKYCFVFLHSNMFLFFFYANTHNIQSRALLKKKNINKNNKSNDMILRK